MTTINRKLYGVGTTYLPLNLLKGEETVDVDYDLFLPDSYAPVIVPENVTEQDLKALLDEVIKDQNITTFKVYSTEKAEKYPDLVKLGLGAEETWPTYIEDMINEAEESQLEQDELTGELIELLLNFDRKEDIPSHKAPLIQERILAIVDEYKRGEFQRSLDENNECFDQGQMDFMEKFMLNRLDGCEFEIPDIPYSWFNRGELPLQPNIQPVIRRLFKVGRVNNSSSPGSE